MPFAFPSHQGIILPLWRRWPRRFDGLALCIGAAMPDVVDLVAWPFRGELGQWMGHSLIGTLVCVPAGLALHALARRLLPASWVHRLGPPAPKTVAMGIGSLSHLASDLVTHANFLLFWPFWTREHLFPAWWSRAWTSVDVFFYRQPYPVAPHFVAWVLVSILGAILFVRIALPGRRPSPDSFTSS